MFRMKLTDVIICNLGGAAGDGSGWSRSAGGFSEPSGCSRLRRNRVHQSSRYVASGRERGDRPIDGGAKLRQI